MRIAFSMSVVCTLLLNAEANQPEDDLRKSVSNIAQMVLEAAANLPKGVDDYTLMDVAALQASIEEFDASRRTARAIKDTSFRQAANEVIAINQAIHKNFDGALETAQLAGPESQVVGEIALIRAKNNDFNVAVSIAGEIRNKRLKGTTFLQLAMLRALAGQQKPAEQLLQQAEDFLPSFSDNIYLISEVATAHALLGHLEQSNALATNLEEKLKDETNNEILIERIATAHVTAGNIEVGINLAHKIKNSYNLDAALLKIGLIRLDKGQEQETFNFALSMNPDEMIARSDLLLEITKRQAKTGRLSKALETAGHIKSPTYRASAFARIGQAQFRAGEHMAARKIFSRARESISKIDRESWKAEALARLSRIQFSSGDVAAGQENLNQSFQIARKIDYLKLTTPGFHGPLQEIVLTQIQIGELDEALETLAFAQEMTMNFFGKGLLGTTILRSLQDIAVHFVKAGDLSSALCVAQSAKAEGYVEATYAAIAKFQGLQGEHKTTLRWIGKQVPASMKSYVLVSLAKGVLERLGVESQNPLDRIRMMPRP